MLAQLTKVRENMKRRKGLINYQGSDALQPT